MYYQIAFARFTLINNKKLLQVIQIRMNRFDQRFYVHAPIWHPEAGFGLSQSKERLNYISGMLNFISIIYVRIL